MTTLLSDLPVYEVRRATGTPAGDGWLDSPAWGAAQWVERFVDVATWQPAKPVRAALLWDAQTLYLGVQAGEPMLGRVRAEAVDAAGVAQDDVVELCLDAELPGVEYIVVSVNPLGVVSVARMVVDNPGWGSQHAAAAAGIRTAARLTGHGWQVEVAIPFAALGLAAPRPGDAWGGNVRRMDRLGFSWTFWALEDAPRYNYEDPKVFPRLRFAPAATVPVRASVPPAAPWPQTPRFQLRGLMYDTSRGSQVYSPQYWLNRLPLLSDLGLNTVLMYYENHLRYPSHPEFAPDGAWTLADLRRVQDAAAGLGIDVIPAQTSLGHCTGILTHPAYRHLAEEGSDGYQFCVAHPETGPMLTEIFADLATASRSPFVSINADESAYLGLCPRCREAFPGWSRGRIFQHHILKIHAVLQAHGKRMMMWDDMLWLYPDAVDGLPRDIVLLDWHYSLHRRYPSVPVWRKLGFDVVVCPGMYLAENAFWLADEGVEHGAMGLINTLWEDHSLPFGTRWDQLLATSWAAHAAAPESVADWYALAGRRLFGEGGERLGRAVAARAVIRLQGTNGTREPHSAQDLAVRRQLIDVAARLLASPGLTGVERELLDEFQYGAHLARLEAEAALRAAGSCLATMPRDELLRLAADLKAEALRRWQQQCIVPSQQPAYLERFTAIEKLLGATP